MIGGTDLKLVRTVEFLSHFWPMFPFFASLTNQKIYGFLVFSEDIRGYFQRVFSDVFRGSRKSFSLH